VASRLVERYNKPCILICFDDELAKGSARSIKGLNIFDLLQNCSEELLKFGGHEMAAGLTLKRQDYDQFKNKMIKLANEVITDEMMIPTIEMDCEIKKDDLNLETFYSLSVLEPFGVGNNTPVFYIDNIYVKEIMAVGQGKHLRLTLGIDDIEFKAMYFNMNIYDLNCVTGDMIDITCVLGENTYNDTVTLVVNVKNLRLHDNIELYEQKSKQIYNQYLANDLITEQLRFEKIWLQNLYKFISRQINPLVNRYNIFALARQLSYIYKLDYTYANVVMMLRIIEELNLISVDINENNNVAEIKLNKNTTKVDLNISPLWNKLNQ